MRDKIWIKYRYWLLGLAGILCVIIFSYSVLEIYKDTSSRNSQSELAELRAINKSAREAELKAISQRDYNRIKLEETSIKISRLEGKADMQTLHLRQIQDDYVKNAKQLNTIKNEKDYIPDNAPISKQAKLLAEYEYQPY